MNPRTEFTEAVDAYDDVQASPESAGQDSPTRLPPAWLTQQEARTSKSQRFDYFIHRALLGADILAIIVSAGLAALVADLAGREPVVWGWWGAVLLTVPLWVLIAHSSGLYRMVERRFEVDFVDEFGPVVVGATAWIWGMVVVRSALFSGKWDLFAPLCLWVILIVTVLLFRAIARHVARGRSWYRRPVAVIGREETAEAVVVRMNRHSDWGLDPTVKIIREDERDQCRLEVIGLDAHEDDRRYVGCDPVYVAELVAGLGIDRVVIAEGLPGLDTKTELIRELVERRIGVDVVSGGVETVYSTAVAHHMEGLPILGVRPSTERPLASRLKRLIDIVVSSTALMVLSPVLLWAAIKIKRDTPGPVFYRQARAGLQGRRFEVLKLRTMVDGAHAMHGELRSQTIDEGNDDVLFKLKEDPRITRSGRMLRKWSLDELPQLWNVLRGDMSMVGPRPLIPEEAAMVTDHFVAREMVRPGIAGPWQFLGRSDIPFEDMVRLDYAYVTAWSNAEDMRLLMRTFTAVLRRKGAY